jgi:ferric-dicitrate binding protein FerR (iron transport regulator)
VSKPQGKNATSAVTETQGTVYVVSGNSRKPAKNTNPKPGDKVETGANSRAVLSIGDSSSQVEVGPNSELGIGLASSITGLVPNLNLWVGNAILQVNDPKLVVTTPVAGITGSEGAEYRLRVVLDATTTVTVHKGTVRLTPTVDVGKILIVLGRGDRVKIYPTGHFERDRF